MKNEPIYNLLNAINYPEDLRELDVDQLPEVCDELRQDIIKELCCNPGHFAASLAVGDLRPALAALDIPTLVIHGRHDKVIPLPHGKGEVGDEPAGFGHAVDLARRLAAGELR